MAATTGGRRREPLPALSLTVQYAQREPGLPDRAQVRRWLRAALTVPTTLAVRFVGEEEGRTLNRDYRGSDHATNVLSFVYDPAHGIDGVSGDLVLCVPVVAREARQQGKTLEAHYAHLTVHGALHLQGHDHVDEAEAEAMEALERTILAGLGYPDPYR